MQYVNPNKLSDAVCNIYDVKNTISSVGLNNIVKDNEGTEITIGDCIHDILLFLEELEANSPYKDDDDPIQDSDNNTFIIRNKCRGYGVLASYPTREQAESNLWRYAMHGGDLVVEIARTKVPALDVNGKFIYNEGSTA